MPHLHADRALTSHGWARDVRITVENGRVSALSHGAAPLPGDERHAILVPAMPNLHSHAFQRGMAGLAERRGTSPDSFWSWRDVMYRFALAMTPDQVEAVAAQLYVEMLEAGFCRVGEFHYLHHAPDGSPYAAPAEMAQRIAAASAQSGIGLTLLPVFYAHSGFGGAVPAAAQRRFVSSLDLYARMLEDSRSLVAALDGGVFGIAPHSLRAVTQDELSALIDIAGAGPIHIHLAEQVKEVEDCLAWSGARPVEWLLEHAPVDARWCLIHATHMTPRETQAMAASGAVAGLCPITEANLGDGVFDAGRFLDAQGRFGIGSDSNILIGIPDELRQLEYSQRLANRARNLVARPGGSCGRMLFETALKGGATALGVEAPALEQGAPAHLVSLDAHHPALAGRDGDALLDSWIFATSRPAIDCVWVAGRKWVEGGRHVARDAIAKRFAAVMADLGGL